MSQGIISINNRRRYEPEDIVAVEASGHDRCILKTFDASYLLTVSTSYFTRSLEECRRGRNKWFASISALIIDGTPHSHLLVVDVQSLGLHCCLVTFDANTTYEIPVSSDEFLSALQRCHRGECVSYESIKQCAKPA